MATLQVTTYGAVHDGTTDDITAINAAITAAAPGDIVHFTGGAGTYMIGAPVIGKTGVTLDGDGKATTIIRNLDTRDPANTVMVTTSAPGVTNFVVQELGFDQRADYFDDTFGYATDQPTIDLSKTITSKVQDCGFANARTMAIYGLGTDADPLTSPSALRNEVFEATGAGIVFAGKVTSPTIDANPIANTQDDAIAVQDALGITGQPTNSTITNNTIDDCDVQNALASTPAGIRVSGADHSIVTGNTITNTYTSGVVVEAGVSHRATYTTLDNVISGSGSNNTDGVTPTESVTLSGADHVTIADSVIRFEFDTTDVGPHLPNNPIVTMNPLSSGNPNTPGTSFVTASTTPTTGRLQLLAFNVFSTTPPITNPTVTGNGLTWVQVAKVDYQVLSGEHETLFVYRARGTASTGAITITAAETWQEIAYSLAEFGVVDTSGTNGSGACIQVVPASSSAPGTSHTLTFAASGSPNAVWGVICNTGAGAITPGGSFIEIHDLSTAGIALETQWLPSLSVTSLSGSWSVLAPRAGVAIEIKAAAITGTASIASRDPLEDLLSLIAR